VNDRNGREPSECCRRPDVDKHRTEAFPGPATPPLPAAASQDRPRSDMIAPVPVVARIVPIRRSRRAQLPHNRPSRAAGRATAIDGGWTGSYMADTIDRYSPRNRETVAGQMGGG